MALLKTKRTQTRKPVAKSLVKKRPVAKRPNRATKANSKKHPLHKRILRHLTERGFTKPKVLPLLAAVFVAGIGTYFMVFSKAATPAPNTGSSAPAISSWGPNRLDGFVRGTDNALYHIYWGGSSWSGWENLGGVLASSPTAVSWGPNRIDVFARGTDNAIWHIWWTGTTWSHWESLGGSATSAPAVSSWASGRLDLFARGTDGALHHKFYNINGGWSGWANLGGTLTSSPTAVSWGANRIDVFARGTDNALYTKIWTGSSWTGWSNLGGTLTSAPAASSWGANRLDIFARGTDNALHHKYWGGSSWSGWEKVGGVLTSSPTAVSWGANRVDFLARGTDGAVHHSAWANAWAGWDRVGAITHSGSDMLPTTTPPAPAPTPAASTPAASAPAAAPTPAATTYQSPKGVLAGCSATRPALSEGANNDPACYNLMRFLLNISGRAYIIEDSYTARTRDVISVYQYEYGIEPANGVFGPSSWEAIENNNPKVRTFTLPVRASGGNACRTGQMMNTRGVCYTPNTDPRTDTRTTYLGVVASCPGGQTYNGSICVSVCSASYCNPAAVRTCPAGTVINSTGTSCRTLVCSSSYCNPRQRAAPAAPRQLGVCRLPGERYGWPDYRGCSGYATATWSNQ